MDRAVAPACISAAKAWISSPPSAPTMLAPRMRSLSGSTISLRMPAVSSVSMARAIEAKGICATSCRRPRAFASRSVSPTLATCGSVNTTEGMTRPERLRAGRPDACAQEKLDALAAEHVLERFRYLGVLTIEKVRASLDDGHG